MNAGEGSGGCHHCRQREPYALRIAVERKGTYSIEKIPQTLMPEWPGRGWRRQEAAAMATIGTGGLIKVLLCFAGFYWDSLSNSNRNGDLPMPCHLEIGDIFAAIR